jgi:hypothetical protein
MAMDIYLFIEYDVVARAEPFSKRESICSLTSGRFLIALDRLALSFFERLAPIDLAPRFDLHQGRRRLPAVLSSTVFSNYYHLISAGPSNENERGVFDQEYQVLPSVSESVANEWLTLGLVTVVESDFERLSRRFVSDPRWHSENWITASELDLIKVRTPTLSDEVPVELACVLSSVQQLGNVYGASRTRVVYWFDERRIQRGS